MNDHLGLFAKNIGLLGILLSVGAIVMRVFGQHYLFGAQSVTIMQGGIALMLVSCVIRLNFLNKP